MRVEEQLRDIWRDFRDDLGPDGVTEMDEESIFNRVRPFAKTHQWRINLDIKNLEYLLCIMVLY